MTKGRGPRADRARSAQRFRSGLPKRRVVPTVASVLGDIITIAQREVDRIVDAQAKGTLTGGDVSRLESLVTTIERAQRTEERVREQMEDELRGASDDDLEDIAK